MSAMKESEIRNREVFNRYLEMSRRDVGRFFADSRNFECVPCPACGGTGDRDWGVKDGFRYGLCVNCRTMFVNPRPVREALLRFYQESESASFWVNEFFKPVAEARRAKIFRPRAEHISTQLKREDAVVGDIGAGFGLFLSELKAVRPNMRCVAIEPSREMADICRSGGLEVIESGVESVKGHDGTFDLLTSFEMFEHLYSPGEVVEKIHHLLRPGGAAFVTTLNGCGFDIMLLGERSKSVSPPHHLNFFNPSSMRQLFERRGFEVVEVSTPGKLDWNIVEGMYRSEGVDIGPLWSHVADVVNDEGKEELQKWISVQGLSSHMRLLAKKR